MSYILDALKKSDQKRQHSQIAYPQTIPNNTLPESAKDRQWPYIITGILVLNIIVAAILLHFWWPEHPAPVATQISENQSSATQVKMEEEVFLTSVPVIRDIVKQEPLVLAGTLKIRVAPQPQAAVNQTPPLETAVTTTITAQHDPIISRQTSQEPIVKESAAEQPAVDQQEKLLPHTSEEPLVIPAQPRIITPITKPVASAKLPTTAPHRQSTRHVLHFIQLPRAIQQALPEFNVAAHVYSPQSTSRLVSINGRILREGQTLLPGLKVDEITADGIIFSYQNYLFKVPVF